MYAMRQIIILARSFEISLNEFRGFVSRRIKTRGWRVLPRWFANIESAFLQFTSRFTKVAKAQIFPRMPRGAKPGERRGGRQKGVPNKATLARASAIAEQKQKAGQKLGVEVMSEAMMHFRALAAKYQVGGPAPNEKLFVKYLSQAASIAADVAPYESSKLQSTTLRGDKDQPITHTLNVHFV